MPSPPGLGQPFRDSFRALGLYARGQFFLCVALAVLYAVAFGIIQVPYWYLIGIVGGCATIIPRIGGLVPLGLAVVALDLTGAPISRFLIVLAVWFVIQGIEFFVLLPRFIGRPLGLKELPVLAAVLLGSLFFGPIGLLLAVPVLAIVLIFWRHFRGRGVH